MKEKYFVPYIFYSFLKEKEKQSLKGGGVEKPWEEKE